MCEGWKREAFNIRSSHGFNRDIWVVGGSDHDIILLYVDPPVGIQVLLQLEWTDDMSNDPLNKRPVSDLYPHGTPMSTHCPPALRENLPPPPAAINDLPPPLIEYLHLLHQHIQHLADQVLLLQSNAQHVHHPAPQDSTISVPSPLNHSSSTTSKRVHSRSYSHVVSQSLPPPASLSHQDHPPARDLDRSKQLKDLIRAKPDQKDRLASLLCSPSAPTPALRPRSVLLWSRWRV